MTEKKNMCNMKISASTVLSSDIQCRSVPRTVLFSAVQYESVCMYSDVQWCTGHVSSSVWCMRSVDQCWSVYVIQVQGVLGNVNNIKTSSDAFLERQFRLVYRNCF